MAYRVNYPLDRLRIKVRRQAVPVVEEYRHDNFPEELRPHIERALLDLRNSCNPTQARTYQIGPDRLSVWYKTKWGKIIHDVPRDAWTGRPSHTWVERYRKWP